MLNAAKARTNVPRISESRFRPTDRIAGPVQKTASFNRVCRRVEVILVLQPHEEGAAACTEKLRRNIGGNLCPRKLSRQRQRDRNRRVEMRSAGRSRDQHPAENGHRPAERDDDPPAAVPFRAGQQDVGDDAVPEKDQQSRPDQLREQGIHGSPRIRFAGGRRSCRQRPRESRTRSPAATTRALENSTSRHHSSTFAHQIFTLSQ